MLTLSPSSWF